MSNSDANTRQQMRDRGWLQSSGSVSALSKVRASLSKDAQVLQLQGAQLAHLSLPGMPLQAHLLYKNMQRFAFTLSHD